MSAPALPRPDLASEAARLDAAYTQAVQHASRSGDWSGVQPAAHAAQQARAALKAQEGQGMKALTVKQPWAWAIIHFGKDVENRSRPTKYRGQLYIHAGKDWADEGLDAIGAEAMPADEALIAGMMIGTVDVIDCHAADDCEGWAETGSRCSEWAMPGHYHWVLANPRPLACPFPEKGKLGIWNFGEVA